MLVSRVDCSYERINYPKMRDDDTQSGDLLLKVFAGSKM